MKEGEVSESDRAVTHYELGIPDGIFGDEIEVDATIDGLEFGNGYSILPWSWILSAFQETRPVIVGALSVPRESGTQDREGATASSPSVHQ